MRTGEPSATYRESNRVHAGGAQRQCPDTIEQVLPVGFQTLKKQASDKRERLKRGLQVCKGPQHWV